MPPPLRVLMDGRALTDASSFRGIGTYVRHVLEGLARHPDIELTVLCRRRAVLPDGTRRLTALRVAPGRFQDREHELLLPLDVRRRRSDVVLAPALDAPRSTTVPWVQTVHDAWPEMNADSGADLGSWRRQSARYRKAAAVIACSRWGGEGAVELLGVDPARVHVIPHGVSEAFRPGAGPVGPPYLLFVGEYDPRKRHHHAFAAIAALAQRGHPHRLKVTGRIAPWYAQRMDELVGGSPRPDLIDLLGHVSFDELVRLYQGASALLVTSEGEGFGLPALEAMASGTPVVAYDNTATTEIVWGAGELVPDGDLDSLVASLVRVVEDPVRRSELVRLGVERAAQFSWEASVEAHVAVLREAAAS